MAAAPARRGVPKPVVTYFGERHLLTNVVLKKLQTRLRSLQFSSLTSLAREDQGQGFSDLCDGVEFIELQNVPEARGQYPRPLHSRPALHTFWTECWKQETYTSITRPLIQQWLQMLEKVGDGVAECVIVYCITAEVRAKRQRTLGNLVASSHVMEGMRNDFKSREMLLLRLMSSDESRVLDSLQAFCTRLASLCRTKFQKDIEVEAELVACQRSKACQPKDLYGIFLQKLNLAVSYEMTLQCEEALQLYQEAATDLETSIASYYDRETPPTWLRRVQEAPCDSWDYPKLVWHHLAWQYLPVIQTRLSPLLHIHTFLLVRISHLLFTLERAWTVSDLVISTLHSMAREIRTLKLPLPDGAFDCWAYMACNEAVLAIMSRINPDTLVDSTTSLLLVRAELWHYALDKLYLIGGLCELMPSSNALNKDNILIEKLINGISPVSFEVGTNDIMEDQGKKLRDILDSKESFKQEYLMLGEMVIGAFKHAGRRRMAFRVGTKMARFHRDLGMMPEAEELLSDICRFYSEDKWLELSAPSYALLADCQRSLELEDQYVNTLVLLASLPAFPSATHDPAHWMDQLISVANKSPYQKILCWSPLLELVGVRMGEGGGVRRGGGEGVRRGGREGVKTVSVRESVTLEVDIKSLAPKPMRNVVVVLTLVTQSDVSPVEQATSVASLEPCSPGSPAHSSSPLEDLDLNTVASSGLPQSRPIGQFTKARTTSTTHFSSSSIMELEERRQRNVKVLLSAVLPSLPPGLTAATITGQIHQAGEYFPQKVSIKCGSLDFVISAPSPRGWWELPLVATKTTEDIAVSLMPTLGIFLAGYPQECTLTLETGSDVTITKGTSLSLMMSSDVTVSCPTGGNVSENDGEKTLKVSLPLVLPSSTHTLPLHLTFPSLLSVKTTSADKEVSDVEDHTHNYQLSVLLDGQTEPLKASISVPVCQPLTLSHHEHSAGESTYLHLSLENTSPAPLLLRSPCLTADISTTQLHTQLPQALAPGGNFSCVWQTQPDTRPIGEDGKATFRLQYKPLIADQETLHVDLSYTFPVSNMQTIFHSQLFTDGLTGGVGRVATLKYDVRNVATSLPHSQLPSQLHYCVSDPDNHWRILDSPTGILDTPLPGKSAQICIQAVPGISGTFPPPRLTLSVLRVGSKVAESDSKVSLTPAQVYELSLGETVTVS